MSRRVVAPLLLLLAAALSLAAVFAVQRIEAAGGPLSEPSASTFFSPDGDGAQDEAEVRFTTRRPEHVTVDVRDVQGRLVRRLLDGDRVDGAREIPWDGRDSAGRIVPQGPYRVHLRRRGDSRTYSPSRPIVVDVDDPTGRLDRATWENGELRGLAFLEPDVRLEVVPGRLDEPLEGMVAFHPRQSARSAQPVGAVPPGTLPVRFTVPVDPTSTPIGLLRIDAVDRAGNRTRLHPGPDAPDIRVLD